MERLRERAVDPAGFRDVLGRFATGITIVAGLGPDGRPAGFACQSFASLSLDPPLVMLAVGTASTSWPLIERTGRFCVNILAEHQRATCVAFGRSGPDKFAGVPWSTGEHGTVRIEGALAHVECEVAAVYEAGDHHLVTARVLALDAGEDGRPLLYFRSRYAVGAF